MTLDVTRVQQTETSVIEFWGVHTYVLEVRPLDGVDQSGIQPLTYTMQVKGAIDRPSRRITLTESEPSRPEEAITEGIFEGVLEREGVARGTDFTLRHIGPLRIMKIFNRVLDGDDMITTVGIDRIDKCGQGGGFPASGGSCYKDQSLARLCQ